MGSKETLQSYSQLHSVPFEFDLYQARDLLCDALNVESGHNTASSPSLSLPIILQKFPSPFSGLDSPLPKIMVVIITLFFYEVKT